MHKYLIPLFLIVLSFQSQASTAINDDRVTKQKSCFSSTFKDYATWRGFLGKKYKKQAKSEQELADKLFWFDTLFGEEKFNRYKSTLTCTNFKYKVEGITVNGFVIKPQSTDKKLPVLVYNRGGNGNYGSVVFGSMMNNLFPIASEGFVIIGSQYRGTHTKKYRLDEFGGKDVNDVIELFNYIPKIEGADPKRLGMYGFSRGGMQTFLALKRAKNVKAVASVAGVTDLLAELDFRPKMENVYKARIPNYATNKVAELEKRSVLKWVDKLPKNVPILLLHGESDERVSAKNSVALADKLVKADIAHKLVIYPNDDHSLKINRDKANKEIVDWFREYL